VFTVILEISRFGNLRIVVLELPGEMSESTSQHSCRTRACARAVKSERARELAGRCVCGVAGGGRGRTRPHDSSRGSLPLRSAKPVILLNCDNVRTEKDEAVRRKTQPRGDTRSVVGFTYRAHFYSDFYIPLAFLLCRPVQLDTLVDTN
jgi:hypothetical protein